MSRNGSTSESVEKEWAIDQAECIENTQTLPQRNQLIYSAKASGWKKPFEGGAGMVPLRRRGERSLKPSRFCLICGLLCGHKSVGVPRGYAPLVAGKS